jgi:hypothetical protein
MPLARQKKTLHLLSTYANTQVERKGFSVEFCVAAGRLLRASEDVDGRSHQDRRILSFCAAFCAATATTTT